MTLKFLFGITVILFVANSQKIAMIGGGMASATASMFIREKLNSSIEIHVYEKEPIVGGRAKHINVGGITPEVGGMFIHETFQYVNSVLKYANLSSISLKGLVTVGIWNGDEFTFDTADSFELKTGLKFIWRYGYGQFTQIQELIENFKNRYFKIYEQLELGKSWINVHEMLKDAELLQESQVFFDKYINDKFPTDSKTYDEVLAAVPRAKYNLKLSQLSAVSGLSSLLFLKGPELHTYPFGMSNIVLKTLEKANVKLHLNDQVTEIVNKKGAKIKIKSLGEGNGIEYDYVIISTPLESSSSDAHKANIKIDNLKNQPFNRKFNVEYVVVIQGKLRRDYFNKDIDELPNGVFVTNNATTDWYLLQFMPTDDPQGTVFIMRFSVKPKSKQLDQMFEKHQIIHIQKWEKFPDQGVYDLSQHFFKLDDDICYVNTIESINMFFETSALGARNCVQIMIDQWAGLSQDEERQTDKKKKSKNTKQDL